MKNNSHWSIKVFLIVITIFVIVGCFVIYINKVTHNQKSLDVSNEITLITPSGSRADLIINPCKEVSDTDSIDISLCLGSGKSIVSSSNGIDYYSLVSTETDTKYGIVINDNSPRVYLVSFRTNKAPSPSDITFFNSTLINLINYGLIK